MARTFCAPWEACKALGAEYDDLEKFARTGELRVLRDGGGRITEVVISTVNALAQKRADAPRREALAEVRGRLRESELRKIQEKAARERPWFADL